MNCFGKALSDTLIMLQDGTELGKVYNVEINPQTGTINTLLMTSSRDARSAEQPTIPFEKDDDGLFRIPAERVQAIEDYIIVSS